MSFWKRTIMILTVTATIFGSTQVMANTQQFKESRQTQATALDVIVARPLGVVVTGIGAVLFAVSLPFSALGGNVSEAADALVVKPAKETFSRCLGCTSSEQKSATTDI